MVKAIILSFLFFTIHGTVSAEPIRVITTGDSLTGQYWSLLPWAFNNSGVSVTVPDPDWMNAGSIVTSRGGLIAKEYSGQSPHLSSEEPINYAANVLAADPDVIVFMLGTNDSLNSSSESFEVFKSSLGPIFSQLSTFTNGRGEHPNVLIGSIPPTASYASTNDRIQNLYNPWLQQQAALNHATYVDTWTAMQADPDWKTKYKAADGIHFSNDGVYWIATQFANAATVPEPSSIALLATCIIGVLAYRCSKRKT
jgi:lysophospholipase L1-like esterase